MQKILSKEAKNKIAEKCFLYDLYYPMIREYLRFSTQDYLDIESGFYKPEVLYGFKCRQLTAMMFILEKAYIAPNNALETNELYGWTLELMRNRLDFFLQSQLSNLFEVYQKTKRQVLQERCDKIKQQEEMDKK